MLLFGVLFLMGCDDKRIQTVTWTEFQPIYISEQEFIQSVGMLQNQDLVNPGKIYFNNGFLFVNEIDKGIHVIDNTDPSSPVNVGFINIPANKDLAVKGDYLYADSNTDLLIFDISDLQNPELITRKEDVFSYWSEIYFGFPYQPIEPSKGIVIGWEEVEIKEVCETDDCYIYNSRFGLWGTIDAASGVSFEGSGSSTGSASQGVGGSMARFTISGEFLYAVDNSDLITFNISTSDPVLSDEENIGWQIETIFSYQEHLFIGSQNAMYIYSIANQADPSLISTYRHLTSCDPVVVEGKYAYVTLRQGDLCPRGVNRLEVIDIENLTNPQEVGTYDMESPHGLGIDGNYLFVSEGEKGLKVMDASDPLTIKELRFIQDIKTYDVIPLNNILMVTGNSGIVQYDYTDINNITLLSTIPVVEQ